MPSQTMVHSHAMLSPNRSATTPKRGCTHGQQDCKELQTRHGLGVGAAAKRRSQFDVLRQTRLSIELARRANDVAKTRRPRAHWSNPQKDTRSQPAWSTASTGTSDAEVRPHT